jgi:hypothetical protein
MIATLVHMIQYLHTKNNSLLVTYLCSYYCRATLQSYHLYNFHFYFFSLLHLHLPLCVNVHMIVYMIVHMTLFQEINLAKRYITTLVSSSSSSSYQRFSFFPPLQ